MIRCLGTVFLSAGISAFSQTPDSLLNRLSAAEQRAGWILLFDGVDKNANWRVGENGTTNNWLVQNNTLASPNIGNELFSKQTYSNFEYSLEWKLSQMGNSGVFFRADPVIGRFCSSSEYAILDDVNGADRTAMGYMPGETAMPIKRTGATYDFYPTVLNGVTGGPYVALAKPYDQWNFGVIWANGNFIENWLNGEKVTDYELGTADWLQRFQFSKYYNMCPNQRATYARHPAGLLGMQDHGGGLLVWFRNLKVRPFVPGEKLVSPLVSPNGGNFSGSVKVVLEAAITGSVIRYTLDGSDPTATSTIYTDTLTLSATTTVRARTFRARFTTSDAAGAVFTRNAVPISARKYPAKFNGEREIFTLDGRQKSGLESGLHVVRTRAGVHLGIICRPD